MKTLFYCVQHNFCTQHKWMLILTRPGQIQRHLCFIIELKHFTNKNEILWINRLNTSGKMFDSPTEGNVPFISFDISFTRHQKSTGDSWISFVESVDYTAGTIIVSSNLQAYHKSLNIATPRYNFSKIETSKPKLLTTAYDFNTLNLYKSIV